jgi:hypothetical protein
MATLINLGLIRSEHSKVAPKAPLNVAAVTDCLTALWGRSWKAEVHTSDTEPTLVIEVPASVSHATLSRLAHTFDQDAVAAYDVTRGEGKLSGPRASEWGSFNPDYFLIPGGYRLSALVPSVAA